MHVSIAISLRVLRCNSIGMYSKLGTIPGCTCVFRCTCNWSSARTAAVVAAVTHNPSYLIIVGARMQLYYVQSIQVLHHRSYSRT